MHSLYPSRKRSDLGLSSTHCLVNPHRLSPSCSNQDPFSPVCVFMKLSVCLSVFCGGWWDVEWRFLWPVAPYVTSQSWNHLLIHMPLLKHTPLKAGVCVRCSCFCHNPSKCLYHEFSQDASLELASVKQDHPETNLSHLPPWHRRWWLDRIRQKSDPKAEPKLAIT